jgi:WD40 repeat protein
VSQKISLNKLSTKMTISIALFMFCLAANKPSQPDIPDNLIERLGTPAKISFGMAILPGERGIVTMSENSIVTTSLDGLLDQSIRRTELNAVHQGRLFSKSTVFFSSDFNSLFTNEVGYHRYSFPLDRDVAPEKIETKLDDTIEGRVYGVQCAGNNQLVGLTPKGELHRYSEVTKKWIRCDSRGMPILEWPAKRWFEAKGSTVVLAGRQTLKDRDKPVVATIHDLDRGRDLEPIRFEKPYDFSLSRDGKTLAAIVGSMTPDGWHVQVWDLPKREMRKISLRQPADRIFLSADGTKFACVDLAENSDLLFEVLRIPSIHFYDAERGKLLSSSSMAGDTLWFGHYLSDNKTFFAVGKHGVLHRWDVATGKPFQMREGHNAPIVKVFHLPEGYATLGRDGQYIRWGTDGKPKSRWEVLPQVGVAQYVELCPFALSPDGKTLYALELENVAKLVARDLSTGKLIPEFQYQLPEDHNATALCVSPDGKRVGVSLASAMRDPTKKRGFVLLNAANGKPIPVASTPDGDPKAQLGRSFQMMFTAPNRILAGNIQGYHAYKLSTGAHDSLSKTAGCPPAKQRSPSARTASNLRAC